MDGTAAKKRILVIDDDADIRETLHGVLDEMGYEVTTSANGREALSYLTGAAAHPGLILLDLMMPVMSGAEFRREQRRHRAFADIPVVIMTAVSKEAEESSGLDPAGILKKPVHLDTLLDTVERCCR